MNQHAINAGRARHIGGQRKHLIAEVERLAREYAEGRGASSCMSEIVEAVAALRKAQGKRKGEAE